ncbi:ZIP metal ion transporter-like protein [Xylogone sp. PMI_703]|nr:ZIP metal ion transporter-like protein [Xylogone sp. PMI_703]
MLDGLFILLSLSVVMAIASFFAGALPLSMALSTSQLRLISAIGMGVLVGTSLIVIIPEGIETLYASGTNTHSHGARGLQVESRSPAIQWPPTTMRRSTTNLKRADMASLDALPGSITPANLEILLPTTSKRAEETSEEPTEPDHSHEDGDNNHEETSPTIYIGLALISGFVLMFLIDKLPKLASERLQPPPATRHISLDNLSQGLHRSSSVTSTDDEESESFLQSLTPTPKQSRSLATTTGLVIHAAADGIAMGASATTADTKLGFIIFIAIMLHKAPAAFGLTSILLKQGLSKRAARGHLIIFSLAAPFGAISTWLVVNMLGGGNITGEGGQWWTGMLLLFSGGTFLYVAMHAMQEDPGHDHGSSNGYADGGISQRKQQKPQMRDTFAAVGGMLIPLLAQIGGHH